MHGRGGCRAAQGGRSAPSPKKFAGQVVTEKDHLRIAVGMGTPGAARGVGTHAKPAACNAPVSVECLGLPGITAAKEGVFVF